MKKEIFLGLACAVLCSAGTTAQVKPEPLGTLPYDSKQHDWMALCESITICNDSLFVRNNGMLMTRPVFHTPHENSRDWRVYILDLDDDCRYLKNDNRIIVYKQSSTLGFENRVFYISENYGKTFEEMTPEFSDGFDIMQDKNLQLDHICGCKEYPDRLFLSGNNGVVTTQLISEDFGKTWREIKIPFDYAFYIWSCPTDENILATGGFNQKDDSVYVAVSHDKGATWENRKVGEGYQGIKIVTNIEFNPENSDEIRFLSYQFKGHSIDGGQTWDVEPWDGNPAGMVGITVPGFMRDEDNPEVLYCSNVEGSVESGETTRSILFSVDNGYNWYPLYEEKIPEWDYSFNYCFTEKVGNYIVAATAYGNNFYLFDLDVDLQQMASKAILEKDTEGLWEYTNNILSYAGNCQGIKVYDLTGKCAIQTKQSTLDTSSLPGGVYTATLADREGSAKAFKFVRR